MSKLGCKCGHTIVDQKDNLSYLAYFRRDQDFEDYYKWTDDVASFIDAVKNGERDKWIRNYFSETYPVGISNSEIVFDIITKNREIEGTMYQCENCGRIMIQAQDQNLYLPFKPEDERSKDIFKRFRDNKNYDQ